MRSKASSMSLHDYLDSFHSAESKIEDFGFSESIDTKIEIRPSKQAVIKARILLVDGSVLQVREYIDAKYKTEKISYAYHCQDKSGKLIFRYDNARHKPARASLITSTRATGVWWNLLNLILQMSSMK